MTEPSARRYKGDGSVPAGGTPQTRGERGRYLADTQLVSAVNTALIVGQPLLVTGEPGTGKTTLAWSIATELGLGDVLTVHVRSDHRATDALYEVDNLRRFYDAQVQDPRAKQPELYLTWNALGEAIRSSVQRLVLIDEIDKAPRDFPNDLLNEIDQMAFDIPSFGMKFAATVRPVVVITSNSERQLPDPFLRRCVFHRIDFPAPDRLKQIVQERLSHLSLADKLLEAAIGRFAQVRNLPGIEKKPATGELLAWVKVLASTGITSEALERAKLGELPAPETLAKTDPDVRLLRQATG